MKYNSFKGKVIEGNKIGRTIGFPTANIATSDSLPEKGVYIAEIRINELTFYGLLNIGTRPTLELTELSVEIFIFNFSETIYYQSVVITPLHFIRNEKKFNSLKELQLQMEKDKILAEKFLK
jgi:riboflavin kinase / FMN adenylyltransferase